jgi:hypothetical protein
MNSKFSVCVCVGGGGVGRILCDRLQAFMVGIGVLISCSFIGGHMFQRNVPSSSSW